MKRKKKLSAKDKITIYIKKSRPIPWQLCTALCLGLFILLIIFGRFTTVSAQNAPEILTDKKAALRITFTGDIKISSNVREMAHAEGYSGLLKGLKKYWEKSDYVVANISGPLLQYQVKNYTSTREKKEESVYLRPAAMRGLSKAGINLFCFANDDVYNYGRTGIESTIRTLNENEIEYMGIASDSAESFWKEMEYTIGNGQDATHSVAVLNVNDVILKHSTVGEQKAGVVNTSLTDIYEQIYQRSVSSDFVVVYAHFSEGTDITLQKENQTMARSLIDAGADLVIGSSSSLDAMEKYGDGWIVYGLGAMLTDATESFEKDAAVLDFMIDEKGKASVCITPVRVKNGRPVVTTNPLYQKRIQKTLTEKVDPADYSMTESGMLVFSL